MDDSSKDASLKIAKEFESSRVKIISFKNSGASATRNHAFKVAMGDYIQYLDSDDIIVPDKIEKQLIQLQYEDEWTIASGPFLNFINSIENSQTIIKDSGYTNFDRPIDWLVHAAFGKAMFPPVVWLTPRKIIEEVGSWNESLSYNDDSEFFARILLKSRRIVYCENAVSYYRRGISTSLGSRKDREARISELESLNLVTSHMLAYENSLRVREACAYRYRKLIYSLYPEHNDLIISVKQKLSQLEVKGDFNFGNGITHKIGKVVGWKNAKLIQRGYKKIKDSF